MSLPQMTPCFPSLHCSAVQEKMLLMARGDISFKNLGQKQNLAAAREGAKKRGVGPVGRWVRG